MMRRFRGVLMAVGVVLLASCGGGGGDSDAAAATSLVAEESATTTADTDAVDTTAIDTTAAADTADTDAADAADTADTDAADTADTDAADTTAEETTTSLPPGALPGLFDFNEDGTNELTCGTADFQAGLIVRTYCDDLADYANDPEAGAAPLSGALFGIPGPPDDPRDEPITSGASVSPQHLQSATDGKEVVVYTMSSDTVFAVGSDQLQDPARDSLAIVANGIQQSFSGATVQVRGHTDSRGGPDSNQSLSERRAAVVADFFVNAGFDPAAVSSVGLGQTQPNYVEDTDVGRDQNRRIELVVRPT